MEKKIISELSSDFESFCHEEDGVEYWYARDLQKLLGYERWDTFELVLEKAQLSCKNSKQMPKNHFSDVRKMVDI